MKKSGIILLAAAGVTLAGCASVRTLPSPDIDSRAPSQRTLRRPAAGQPVRPSSDGQTVRHTVAPGETLWRIAKIYDVPTATILRANRLPKNADLKMGQQLIVPRAHKPHQPITMTPNDQWKYIIVHHTATEGGSSLSFHKSHLDKGWDRGVGYHFVINNGEGEKPDGFIEVTPRWLKQQDGAHCKAGDMNIQGIGISLVGNFNTRKVSRAQMNSLVGLVNQLRGYYHIPVKNVLGHGHVHGSKTDCPGKKFPWEQFIRKLNE